MDVNQSLQGPIRVGVSDLYGDSITTYRHGNLDLSIFWRSKNTESKLFRKMNHFPFTNTVVNDSLHRPLPVSEQAASLQLSQCTKLTTGPDRNT